MKKFFYFVSVLLISMPLISSAQYKLQPAFPNMTAFSNPTELVNAGDGTNRLFILQQNGVVYVFNNSPAVFLKKVFIDMSPKVTQGGSETGLLGMAFHPNYENNRYFYLSFTYDSVGTGSRTWSRISRFTASSSNPDTVELNSEVILLTVAQPDLNHKGGKIAFGPDGYLYISFGDGGGEGDPFNYAQNKNYLFGKILRINVDSFGVGINYSIPIDNPFYGSGFRQEIYAYGLRNTWKFSFDPPANRIWGADVGQSIFEEVNIIEKGKNYGWNKMEGFHCYPDTNICDTTGKGFTRPVLEYKHNVSGNSITGGYVYRGSLLPGLFGKYIYADYIFGTIWAITYDGINPATNVQLLDSTLLISTFGLDENNEIYAVRYSSSSGRIYKLVDFGTSTLNLKAIVQGFYDSTYNKLNIRDTVNVYLRQNISPFAIIDSAKTVIDSLNFSGLCFFQNAPNGKYYIQLKHRNAIEVWSKTGGDSIKKGSTVSYDFTSDSSKTYGNNSVLSGTKYCLYSGDVVEYGAINLTDIVMVFNNASIFQTGYVPSDLTGNGVVDLNDLIIVFNNSTKFISLIRP